MRRKWLILLLLTPVLVFAIYWVSVYLSLKNPMEEMHYTNTRDWIKVMPFPSYPEVIGSGYSWTDDQDFQTLPYSDNIVGGNEHLSVTVFRNSVDCLYFYDYNLAKDVKIEMSIKYDSAKKILIQDELYLHKGKMDYEGKDLVAELAKYGKDMNWLRAQSKKVVEQYILGTWFKRGSSRYSLKNLGDMKIKYHDLVTKK